jgi:hypothetical protein
MRVSEDVRAVCRTNARMRVSRGEEGVVQEAEHVAMVGAARSG